MVQDWRQLDEAKRETLVDSLVGKGQFQKIKAQADAMGRMVKRSRPVIDGTLRSPDALIEVEDARRPGRGIAATISEETL